MDPVVKDIAKDLIWDGLKFVALGWCAVWGIGGFLIVFVLPLFGVGK